VYLKEFKLFNSFKSLGSSRGSCPRCGGTGYLPHFSHVAGGVCFLCGGSCEVGHDNFENFDAEDFEWTIYMDDEDNVNQQLFELENEISKLYQNNNVQKMPKFLADKISEVMVQESI